MLIAGLILTLAWGAFAFGAVYPWAYVPLGVASAMLGAYGLARGRRRSPGSRLRQEAPAGQAEDPKVAEVRLGGVNRPIAVGLAIVAFAIVLQLVPLPHDTLIRLNPATDEFLRKYDLQYSAMVQTEALHATRESKLADAGSHDSDSHPLSIDPAQTMLGLALLAGFGVLVLGLARGLTARDARRFAPAITAIGAVLGLAGIITKATWSGKIYGLWQPYAADTQPFGPFVNRNHFAGWMVMGAAVGLGYLCALVGRAMRDVKPTFHDRLVWFSSREASRVILVAAALTVMGIALVLSFSRSGTSSLMVVLALVASVVVRRQRKSSRRVVIATYVVFLAVVAVGWAGLDAVAAHFAAADKDLAAREAIWNDAVHIYRDFPVFGSGINTFGTAMMVYQTADPSVHFAEAHNDYVQFLSEGGLLVTIPALLLLVLFVREVRRRFRDDTDDSMTYWIRVGAVAGLIAIALQEIVEFSLQMPGNAAMFCTLAAIAAGKLPHRSWRMKNGKG